MASYVAREWGPSMPTVDGPIPDESIVLSRRSFQDVAASALRRAPGERARRMCVAAEARLQRGIASYNRRQKIDQGEQQDIHPGIYQETGKYRSIVRAPQEKQHGPNGQT